MQQATAEKICIASIAIPLYKFSVQEGIVSSHIAGCTVDVKCLLLCNATQVLINDFK